MVPIAVPVLLISILAGFGAKSPDQPVCQQLNGPAGIEFTTETVAGTDLDAEQMRVATQVVAAVRAFRPTTDTPHAAVVALATARQESGLRNLDHGDRDSLGVFQQRPSQGWGTPAQVRDVTHATTSFLQRLVQIRGWEAMRVTDAAAQVQRPAEQYRGLYEQWVPLATALTERLWGTALIAQPSSIANLPGAQTRSPSQGSGTPTETVTDDERAETGSDFYGCQGTGQGTVPTSCPASGGAAEAGLTPDALRVMRCVLTVFGPHVVGGVGARSNASDHPSGRAVDIMIPDWDTPAGSAEGWRVAGWVQANAHQLGVTYVIFNAKIWSVARNDEGWRTYSHPTGASDPTSQHLDHVHVSVEGHVGYDTPPDGTPDGTPDGPSDGLPLDLDTTSTGPAVVGSFNTLGHHHTEPGGKNAHLDSGPERMSRALDKIQAHHISIIGLQELETPQARTITQRGWGLHRATPNNTFRDGNTMGNAIAWNPHVWTLITTDELQVGYRGRTLHMPIVHLRHASGANLTVLNLHNPAGASEAAWRTRAREAENRTIRATIGPIVITGDFNEHAPSLCAATTAASGGTGCQPTPTGGVDYIFTSGGASTIQWRIDRSTRSNESDVHPLVYATLH